MTNTNNYNFSNTNLADLNNILKEIFKDYTLHFSYNEDDCINSFIKGDDHPACELHSYKINSGKVMVFDLSPWNETEGKLIKIFDTLDELVKYIKTTYNEWWEGLKEIEGE